MVGIVGCWTVEGVAAAAVGGDDGDESTAAADLMTILAVLCNARHHLQVQMIQSHCYQTPDWKQLSLL